MSTQPPLTGAAPPLSLFQRVLGVIFSPKKTYESIVAHPRWLDVLLLCMVVTAGAMYWFLSTQIGQDAMLDQQITQQESWGQVNDEAIKRMEAMAPYNKYIVPGTILLFSPIFSLVLAGIIFGVYKALTAGLGSFKQTLAVVTHAGVIPTALGLALMPLNYYRQSMSSATNLGVFFPGLADNSFLGSFFGSIDLIWLWWTINLAIGVAVLFKRSTSSVATTFLGIYAVIAIIVAFVKSAMGGS
jgi:hypothetical protein